MDKDELKQYLEDNMRVEVNVNSSYYGDGFKVSVRIYIEDKVVTESEDYFG